MMMMILVLLFSFIIADPIPDLTLLRFSTLPAHKIYGYVKTDGTPFGVLSLTGPASITFDPTKGYVQWYSLTFPFNPPVVINTYTWLLYNVSYVSGSFFYPGCLEVSNFNWSNFDSGTFFATDDSNYPGKSYYLSNSFGVESCGKRITNRITLRNDRSNSVFSSWVAAYNLLIPPNNTCYYTRNIVEYDRNTIEYTGFDADFNIDTSCYPQNNPPDLCVYIPTC